MYKTIKTTAAMLAFLFAALCMGGCFAAPDANTAPRKRCSHGGANRTAAHGTAPSHAHR